MSLSDRHQPREIFLAPVFLFLSDFSEIFFSLSWRISAVCDYSCRSAVMMYKGIVINTEHALQSCSCTIIKHPCTKTKHPLGTFSSCFNIPICFYYFYPFFYDWYNACSICLHATKNARVDRGGTYYSFYEKTAQELSVNAQENQESLFVVDQRSC